MDSILAVCFPATDLSFGERVREAIAADRWDLTSPEGLALMQSVLRQSYPLATLRRESRTLAGGRLPTIVLDVFRDGFDERSDRAVRRVDELYGRIGATAYRSAVGIVGNEAAAAEVVEEAFSVVTRSMSGTSIATAAVAVHAAARGLAYEYLARLGGGATRASPSPDLSMMPADQRVAMELATLEGLKVPVIAERMQVSTTAVNRLLRDGLVSLRAGIVPSPSRSLERWRASARDWEAVAAEHPARIEQGVTVAHAWLQYQVASGSIPAEDEVFVLDGQRRYVTTTINAAGLVGRRSLVGLRLDDITPEAARPSVPEVWAHLLNEGSLAGAYVSERPGQTPIHLEFQAYSGRPLPQFQVVYARPLVSTPESGEPPGAASEYRIGVSEDRSPGGGTSPQ